MEHTYVHTTDRHGILTEFCSLYPDASIITLAPHGGTVEPGTDVQAQLLAQKFGNQNVWGTRGIVDGDFNESFSRWHTTSETHPQSFFELFDQTKQAKPYNVAISFHATGAEGIILGGNEQNAVLNSLKTQLQSDIDAPIKIAEEGNPLAGKNPDNFVNSIDSNITIHIEQNIDILLNNLEQIVNSIAYWIRSHTPATQ